MKNFFVNNWLLKSTLQLLGGYTSKSFEKAFKLEPISNGNDLPQNVLSEYVPPVPVPSVFTITCPAITTKTELNLTKGDSLGFVLVLFSSVKPPVYGTDLLPICSIIHLLEDSNKLMSELLIHFNCNDEFIRTHISAKLVSIKIGADFSSDIARDYISHLVNSGRAPRVDRYFTHWPTADNAILKDFEMSSFQLVRSQLFFSLMQKRTFNSIILNPNDWVFNSLDYQTFQDIKDVEARQSIAGNDDEPPMDASLFVKYFSKSFVTDNYFNFCQFIEPAEYKHMAILNHDIFNKEPYLLIIDDNQFQNTMLRTIEAFVVTKDSIYHAPCFLFRNESY